MDKDVKRKIDVKHFDQWTLFLGTKCRFFNFGRLLPAFWLLFAVSSLYSWQAYELYDTGSKGAGLGGAFSAEADDLSAIYWNPAALAYQKKPAIELQFNLLNFTISTLQTGTRASVNYIPSLLAVGLPISDDFKMALGYFTPFNRDFSDLKYVVYSFGPAVSWRLPIKESPFNRLYAGLRGSFDLANADEKYGYGGSGAVSLLWMQTAVSIGVTYQSSIFLYWPEKENLVNVSETLPDILRFGVFLPIKRYVISLKKNKNAIEQLSITEDYSSLSFELSYEGWPAVRYVGSGGDVSFPESAFKPLLNGAIGYQFQDTIIGGLWRLAVKTKTLYTDSVAGIENRQVLLCLGVGVFAREMFRFDFALQDSTLMSYLFNTNLRYVSFYISVRFLPGTIFSR